SDSLASRLRATTDECGSRLFVLRWKFSAMKLGRRIYRLGASGDRTSGIDCTSWPTPNAGPQKQGDTAGRERQVELKARQGNGNGFGKTLGQAASLASWPTPRAEDGESCGNHPQKGDSLTGVAAWATPQERDWKDGRVSQEVYDKRTRPLSD